MTSRSSAPLWVATHGWSCLCSYLLPLQADSWMKSEYRTSVMLSINNSQEFFHELDYHCFTIDQSVFERFGPRIRAPRVELPLASVCSRKSACIGCLATIVVQGKRTSDSSSPHRFTPDSTNTSHSLYPVRQCSFDPVTDRQTNRQTYLIS